jgi:hypothetical protein
MNGQYNLTEILNAKWYAKPNDVIGGWCVMDIDDTPSHGRFEIADFTSQEIAEHIAKLHNESITNS